MRASGHGSESGNVKGLGDGSMYVKGVGNIEDTNEHESKQSQSSKVDEA